MSIEAQIERVVQSQAAAWNDGDLEGFVRHIDQDVVYVTAGGLVRGREALIEAYSGDWRERPGGSLTVQLEQIVHATDDAVTAVVQFWLAGSREDRTGFSLLTFVRRADEWMLVADATLRSQR